MKVWVLENSSFDGEVVGIFSNLKAAEEAKQNPYTAYYHIDEYEIWDNGKEFLKESDYT